MKKVFQNSANLICIFTEDGVCLFGEKKEAFYPYGCMDRIYMGLLGSLEIRFGFSEVTFRPEREDIGAMREAIHEAKALKKTAEPGEAKVYVKCSKVPDTISKEEQLKQFKSLLSTGTISKGYFDLKKVLLLEK